MSNVLDAVRQKYPQYDEISDDDLALAIAKKYPAYLKDTEFLKQVGEAGLRANTPRFDQLPKSTEPPIGLEAASKEFPGSDVREPHSDEGMIFALAKAIPAKAAQELVAASQKLNYPVPKKPGYGSPFPPAKELGGDITAAVEGKPLPIEKTITEISKDKANIPEAALAKISLGIAKTAPFAVVGALPATAQKLIAAGFVADMARHVPGTFKALGTEMGKPENEQDPDKISSLMAEGAQELGFTALGAFHGAKGGADVLTKQLVDRYVPRGQGINGAKPLATIGDQLSAKGQSIPAIEPAKPLGAPEPVKPPQTPTVAEKPSESMAAPTTGTPEAKVLKAGDTAPVVFRSIQEGAKHIGWYEPTEPFVMPDKGLYKPGDTIRLNTGQFTRYGIKLPEAEVERFKAAGGTEPPVKNKAVQPSTERPTESPQSATAQSPAQSPPVSQPLGGDVTEAITQKPSEQVGKESAEIVGMGAMKAGELENNPKTPTGIKNATVDTERAVRGLPPAMEPARRSFGKVWDSVMAKFDKDPSAAYKEQSDLIKELKGKPRAITDSEDAMLLAHQIELQNEYGKSTRDLAQAHDDAKQFPNREADVVELKAKVARLSDQLLDLYNINKTVGTETGRGLNARKMMAYEDYSLAAMETKLRAAKGGKPLEPTEQHQVKVAAEKIDKAQKAIDAYQKKVAGDSKKPTNESLLKGYKTRYANKLEALQAKMAAGDFTKPEKTPLTLDSEALRLKANYENAKLQYDRLVMKERLKNRTILEKTQDTFVKWRRAFLLSSPVTLAKLTAAAIERTVFTPLEEVTGAGLSKIPGISQIAKRAPREGGLNINAEAKAIMQGFTKGMYDAYRTLRTGHSDMDSLYGRRDVMPREVIDFIGSVHGALKAPVKRMEFNRSFEKRVAFALRNGIDVSDPMVQTKICVEAYKDAQRSIFMQDNKVTAAWNAGISILKTPDVTGKVPLGRKALATGMQTVLPIVKVPTNIVAETLQTAFGSVTGSVKVARALAKGIEGLPPEQADLIMRELKKGSLGGALLVAGYLVPNMFGGYYQANDRKQTGHPKFGTMQIGGVNVPTVLIHNPLLETLQIGATIRHVADSKLRKRDQETQGLPAGVGAALLGLTEEVPFVKEPEELLRVMNPYERNKYADQFARDMIVPLGVQWVAQHFDKDKDGNYIPRDPKNLAQTIESAIPLLREKVQVDRKQWYKEHPGQPMPQ